MGVLDQRSGRGGWEKGAGGGKSTRRKCACGRGSPEKAQTSPLWFMQNNKKSLQRKTERESPEVGAAQAPKASGTSGPEELEGGEHFLYRLF